MNKPNVSRPALQPYKYFFLDSEDVRSCDLNICHVLVSVSCLLHCIIFLSQYYEGEKLIDIIHTILQVIMLEVPLASDCEFHYGVETSLFSPNYIFAPFRETFNKPEHL